MANPDSGELVVSCTARDSLQFALQRRFFVFDYSLFSSDRYIFLAFFLYLLVFHLSKLFAEC